MSVADTVQGWAPKACAASHVCNASARSRADAAILFSSITSAFGTAGQGNYAAANSYLDTLALRRRTAGRVGSSLQIPPVTDAGMGASAWTTKQLTDMGALTLDEFVSCVLPLFSAACPASACVRVPLNVLMFEYLPPMPALGEVQLRSDSPTATIVTCASTGQSCFAHELLQLQQPHRHAHSESVVLCGARAHWSSRLVARRRDSSHGCRC